MSVGCWVPEVDAAAACCGSRTGAGGSENVARGTGFTQLLAESTTSNDDPSLLTTRAAGSEMPKRSNPAAGRLAPEEAAMGSTRPPKSVPPCPTTKMVAPSWVTAMPWGE